MRHQPFEQLELLVHQDAVVEVAESLGAHLAPGQMNVETLIEWQRFEPIEDSVRPSSSIPLPTENMRHVKGDRATSALGNFGKEDEGIHVAQHNRRSCREAGEFDAQRDRKALLALPNITAAEVDADLAQDWR